jgi:hypothetical protein
LAGVASSNPVSEPTSDINNIYGRARVRDEKL